MKPLEDYLRALHDIRSSGSGTQETSYYPPLSNLLNEIGKTLKPKVRCIMPLRNQGAGFPDGGFFTSDQFQRVSSAEPLPEQLPSRGVIEVKGTGDDVWKVIKSEQVGRYFERYRQVLVTNYRDFVLVGQDPDGNQTTLETYRFAGSELDFWALTVNPNKTAKEQGERFTEFLKRVMLHAAPLAKNQDVAWFLASYARDARVRIQQRELPALEAVRTALENAVGIKFEGEKGEDFFRSTLIQTLFYGVFAAWILWNKQPNAPRFDWRMAAWSLRVPMIKALFEQVATPTKLGPLGLVEVLDWTGAMLNRVDRTAFFKEFQEEYAVQYFYEPFLQAFDPKLRKDLGVWYTPPEIVKYMVARVDAVLREELDLPDGLADPRVHVLDPCCGTGAYLVEVLKRIAQTIEERGDDALSGDDVKRAAVERVFGFEIIPAPFVIAHLQLGLVLQNLGAPLADEGERVGIYLTNALTGWEPPKEDAVGQLLMNFPELMQERDAADKVKRGGKILVVLGNP
ncbi:N-6 DNA methylase, partial [Candidatus Poribacteria bacterium]|nr:N-6 DNA methylase [Candidatus Poribacteria bacterium]